jgi:hypothetical protein
MWWLCERVSESYIDADRVVRQGLNLHGCKTPENALARIMTGRILGLPAMQAIANIHLLWNKSSGTWTTVMSVKSKLALVYRRKDLVEYVRPKLITATEAIWVGKRRGPGEIEQEYNFTIEDAKTAGLVGRGGDEKAQAANNYNANPKAMLSWRACGRLLDIIAADILLGIAAAEDVEDENRMAEQLREAASEVIERVQKRTLGEKLEQVPAALAPVTGPASTSGPDWSTIAANLKQQITDAFAAGVSPDLKKALQANYKAFEKDAPQHLVTEMQTFYAMTRGKPIPNGQRKPTPVDEPAAAAAAPPAPAPARPLPKCVVCGKDVPGDSAAFVPKTNGWRHHACALPVESAPTPPTPPTVAETPTHDGREPPPGALQSDRVEPNRHPYLPPEQRGEDYEGPDDPLT